LQTIAYQLFISYNSRAQRRASEAAAHTSVNRSRTACIQYKRNELHRRSRPLHAHVSCTEVDWAHTNTFCAIK